MIWMSTTYGSSDTLSYMHQKCRNILCYYLNLALWASCQFLFSVWISLIFGRLPFPFSRKYHWWPPELSAWLVKICFVSLSEQKVRRVFNGRANGMVAYGVVGVLLPSAFNASLIGDAQGWMDIIEG
jgi:hypothetical protein